MGRCWSSPLRHKRLLNENEQSPKSKKRSTSRSCNCQCRHSLAALSRENVAFVGENGVELGKMSTPSDLNAPRGSDISTLQSITNVDMINDAKTDITELRLLLLQLQSVLQSNDIGQQQQSAVTENMTTSQSNANWSLLAEIEQLRSALLQSREETQRAILAKESVESQLHEMKQQLIQSESFQSNNLQQGISFSHLTPPNVAPKSFDELRESPTRTTFTRYLRQQQQQQQQFDDLSDIQDVKVLYFTERVSTPFMTTLRKNPKELCLGDVRRVTQHMQPYHRFIFKRHDPRFGTIKHELRYDHDPVPLWDGKIVVWIFCDSASMECVD